MDVDLIEATIYAERVERPEADPDPPRNDGLNPHPTLLGPSVVQPGPEPVPPRNTATQDSTVRPMGVTVVRPHVTNTANPQRHGNPQSIQADVVSQQAASVHHPSPCPMATLPSAPPLGKGTNDSQFIGYPKSPYHGERMPYSPVPTFDQHPGNPMPMPELVKPNCQYSQDGQYNQQNLYPPYPQAPPTMSRDNTAPPPIGFI